MHNSRSLLCHYSYSHLQLSNHAICANAHPILTTSSSHLLCRHCHVKITIKIDMAFSPESRYTDFTEKYTLEMTSQVIQKRDSFLCCNSIGCAGVLGLWKYMPSCLDSFASRSTLAAAFDFLARSLNISSGITYDGRDYC